MIKKPSLTILFLLLPALVHAGEPERYYQRLWCEASGGTAEVVLSDRTRVDCLTDTHAVEIEFAPKWAEAIGQALHYARMTDRAPGVVLVLRRPSDERHLYRLRRLAEAHGVQVWAIKEKAPANDTL